MPLLAILCLRSIMKDRTLFQLTNWKNAPIEKLVGLPVATVVTAGLCLLLWLAPSVAGNCISGNDAQTLDMMRQSGFPADFVLRYRTALSDMHHDILSGDALRSLCVIVLCALFLWAYAERKMKGWMVCSLLALICLIDLWQIDKRYLNDESFTDPVQMEEDFAKTPADEQILKDKTYFRVANIGAGNPFNETSNATSYYHHSIGGYHAAKLHRYQDLIDRMLNGELQRFVGAINEAEGRMELVPGDSLAPALNMLNTKYFIFGSGQHAQAIENPYANGNAWFVDELKFVPNADAEMQTLQKLDTKHQAVADERFKAQLDGSKFGKGTVKITAYEPNELHYDVESEQGGVVVFSEIYYPGWTATIDGQPAEPGRVNYVLRALKVPAGKHQVKLEFRPASVDATNRIAYAALAIMMLLFVGAVTVHWRNVNKMR